MIIKFVDVLWNFTLKQRWQTIFSNDNYNTAYSCHKPQVRQRLYLWYRIYYTFVKTEMDEQVTRSSKCHIYDIEYFVKWESLKDRTGDPRTPLKGTVSLEKFSIWIAVEDVTLLVSDVSDPPSKCSVVLSKFSFSSC